MGGHNVVTWSSAAYMFGAIGFFYYLSTGHKGPETCKYDMPRLTKERTKDIPEFAALFRPDSHWAIRKE